MSKGKSTADELQQHLQQLSNAFAVRLQVELPALAQNAERLLHAADPQEQLQHLQSLRDQLHKLAGAAGTFGFSSLGQRARELEQEADQWLETLQLGNNRACRTSATACSNSHFSSFKPNAGRKPPPAQSNRHGRTAARGAFISSKINWRLAKICA